MGCAVRRCSSSPYFCFQKSYLLLALDKLVSTLTQNVKVKGERLERLAYTDVDEL